MRQQCVYDKRPSQTMIEYQLMSRTTIQILHIATIVYSPNLAFKRQKQTKHPRCPDLHLALKIWVLGSGGICHRDTGAAKTFFFLRPAPSLSIGVNEILFTTHFVGKKAIPGGVPTLDSHHPWHGWYC